MTIKQTVMFAALALIGGVLGGYLGRPVAVEAQVPPVRFINDIAVPNDGLKFTNEQGKTVAFLGFQGGNTFFSLVDMNGRPSVSLVAGAGGTVTLRGLPDGGEILVGSVDGSKSARFSATGSGTTIEAVTNKTSLVLQNRGNGASLLMPGTTGNTVQLVSGANGGSLSLFTPALKSALVLEGGATGGNLSVRDASGTQTASISGSGVFAAHRNGKAVWQAPAN